MTSKYLALVPYYAGECAVPRAPDSAAQALQQKVITQASCSVSLEARVKAQRGAISLSLPDFVMAALFLEEGDEDA